MAVERIVPRDESDPRWGASSFDCPHCGTLSLHFWYEMYGYAMQDDQDEDRGGIDLKHAVSLCHACKRPSFWTPRFGNPMTRFGGDLLWPRRAGTHEAHEDMPEAVRVLWDEANEVVGASPRSATTLLRLALETLLKSVYSGEGNLNKLIGLAVADGLPIKIQKAMDVLRLRGNENAHEMREDDTAADASAMFNLVNIVVEQLIAQPKHIDEMFDALPDTKKQAIADRDGKGGVE